MNRRKFIKDTVTMGVMGAVTSIALLGNQEAPDLSADVARLDEALALYDENEAFGRWFDAYGTQENHYQRTADRVFRANGPKRIGDMSRDEMIEQIAVAYWQLEEMSAALLVLAREATIQRVGIGHLDIARNINHARLTLIWAANAMYVSSDEPISLEQFWESQRRMGSEPREQEA